jgi:glycosyltransferase involved in cell wall biosynthesis
MPSARPSTARLARSQAAVDAAAARTPAQRQATPPAHASARQAAAEGSCELHGRAGYLVIVPWDLKFAGGVNQVVLSLDRELRRDNAVRPLVLVCDWDSRQPSLSGGTPEVIRYRLRQPGGPLANPRAFVAWLLTLPSTLMALRRLIKALRVEVINVHYPTLSSVVFAVMKALGLTRARFVLSFHGQDAVNASRLSGWQGTLFRFMLSRADATTACSRGLAQQLQSLFPIECPTVEVVHNGIDPNAIEQELAGTPASPLEQTGAPYLLCVSSYVSKKALEVLVDAFGFVSREQPNLRLLIAGRSGPELARVSERVAERGLAQRVSLLIDVPHGDVTRLMRRATMFILPSREEPFGIVLLEAGLAKLPVVATHVGGVPEVISSPELGLLVAPDDATALADAIRTLLADPRRAAALGARLSEHVRHRFSARACALRYLQLALPVRAGARR